MSMSPSSSTSLQDTLFSKNSRNVQGVPKKWDLRLLTLCNDLCSQYLMHIGNKYRYEIFMISAFHGIFYFYSTPFRSLAIVPQRTSLLTTPAVKFYLYSNVA